MDWDDRFREEYFQLSTRTEKLRQTLVNYKKGKLNFKPKCSYDLLNGQYKAMKLYLSYLEERAEVEGLTLR